MPNPPWLHRSTLLRTAVAVLAGFAVYTSMGDSGEGTLSVEIRDQATGEVEPAMVSITSLADGKWRTPPDGRTTPRYTTTRDFYTPGEWKPGDIGPVRLTNGEYNDNDVRSYVYEGGPCYPFWKEPAAYFVSKPFTITLPTGKWRLGVMRGIEYYPVFEEFALAPGERKERKIALRRWVEMAKQGWYSGDDHIHHPRLKPEHNEFLMTWAQAEDLHVANILRMGDIEKTYFEQAGFGKQHRYQKGDYVLVSGQEDPRTGISEQGHTIALDITSPVRDTSRYHQYDFMFDGVHAQGGLAGYAHIAWAPEMDRRADPKLNPTWDASINVPRGKIDFFEIMQFTKLGLEDYYDFLNLGYKLTASAGSDLPWGNTIGEVRVYAHAGARFSADAWFNAMKQGHTFVTNGPMLLLTVDGRIPGDELAVQKNSAVRIRARAWAPEEIGSPKLLEVVAGGKVVRAAESGDPRTSELKAEFDHKIESGQWIAARVRAHNRGLAHTSPVYVLVDGAFRNAAEVPSLVSKRLKVLDFIEARLQDERFTKEEAYRAGEVEALRERVSRAKVQYQEMLAAR